jgi:hypothetical protein
MKYSSRLVALLITLLLAGGMIFAQSRTVSSNTPAALALVKSFEEKLNLEGLDITNTFTIVQKKTGEADRVIQI